jgi:hypothetical protein
MGSMQRRRKAFFTSSVLWPMSSGMHGPVRRTFLHTCEYHAHRPDVKCEAALKRRSVSAGAASQNEETIATLRHKGAKLSKPVAPRKVSFLKFFSVSI